jgi:uncharacterized membrane protein YfcA
MGRWELKYYLVRTGRWIWQRTLTAALLAVIVGSLLGGSWVATAVADHYGADLLFWVCALLVISLGYWVLDKVLWD